MYHPQVSFYEANYHKVVFYMKLSLTIFLCIAAVLVTAYNLSGAFPFFIVITGLVFYLLSSDVVFFTMYKRVMDRNKKRNSIFNSELFQPFYQYGIGSQLIYTKNKWRFTEETLVMSIDGFNIMCNPNHKNKNAVDFYFQTRVKLRQDNVENVISFFMENGVDIRAKNEITGIVKTIEIKKQTRFELYNEVLKTAKLLKNNGFEPFDNWDVVNDSAIFITGE